MKAPIYHFLTGHILARNDGARVNPWSHFQDVLMNGKLIAKRFRTDPAFTMWTEEDPVEDREYIFLTARRDFMDKALESIDAARARGQMKKLRFDRTIMGFILNSTKLRKKPGIYFREKDIFVDGRLHRDGRIDKALVWELTKPFTNQPITPQCEILVHKELDLDEYLLGSIENGIDVLLQ